MVQTGHIADKSEIESEIKNLKAQGRIYGGGLVVLSLFLREA